MRPHINARAYRPRQVVLAKERPRRRRCTLLTPRQCRQLVLMSAAALVIGLGLSQLFHGRIDVLQARVDQLRITNTAMVDENNRLAAAGMNMTSKAQVTTLAKRKLKLFEPDQGQVRRM